MTHSPAPNPSSTRQRRLHLVGFIDSASVFRLSFVVRNLWIGICSTILFAALGLTSIFVASSLLARLSAQRQEIRDLRWSIVTERLRGHPFDGLDTPPTAQANAAGHGVTSSVPVVNAEESALANPAEPILPEQLMVKQRRGAAHDELSLKSTPVSTPQQQALARAQAPAQAAPPMPTQAAAARTALPVQAAAAQAHVSAVPTVLAPPALPPLESAAIAFAAAEAAPQAPGDPAPIVGIEALQGLLRGEKQLELNFSLVNPDQASGVSLSGKVCVVALNASGAMLSSFPRGLNQEAVAAGSCNRGVPVKFARFRPTSVTLPQPGPGLSEVAVIFTDSRAGTSLVRRFQKKNAQ